MTSVYIKFLPDNNYIFLITTYICYNNNNCSFFRYYFVHFLTPSTYMEK